MTIPIKARGLSVRETSRRQRARRSMSRRMGRTWSLWLLRAAEWHVLRHMLAIHRRAAASSQAARAALDDLPVPQAASGAARSAARFAVWQTPLPLRYAAHLVAMLLVLAVVCWPTVPTVVEPPVGGVVSVSDTQAELADPQLVPTLPQAAQAPAEADTFDAPTTHDTQALFASSLITTHRLSEGETLADVATRYGVTVQSLFWMNNLQNTELLRPEQELRIPRVSGILHTVEEGETLDSIAEAFGATAQSIASFPANALQAGETVQPGRELFIPGGTRPYPAAVLERYGGEQGIESLRAVTAALVRESGTSLRIGPSKMYDRVAKLDAGRYLKLVARHDDWLKVEALGQGQGWIRSDLLELPPNVLDGLAETSDFPPLPPTWVWPTRGAISSPFGWRFAPFRSFHDGVDIANRAGTPIYAARAGRVIEAGWCSGFGYCVKINHGEGMVSIYGHLLRQPSVRVGQGVDAGDPIGLMGSTFDRRGGGYSTGNHLHFTVKINGNPVNPLKFLP